MVVRGSSLARQTHHPHHWDPPSPPALMGSRSRRSRCSAPSHDPRELAAALEECGEARGIEAATNYRLSGNQIWLDQLGECTSAKNPIGSLLQLRSMLNPKTNKTVQPDAVVVGVPHSTNHNERAVQPNNHGKLLLFASQTCTHLHGCPRSLPLIAFCSHPWRI